VLANGKGTPFFCAKCANYDIAMKKQTSIPIESHQFAEEEKKSLNKLLESSFFCQYKVQLIKNNTVGEISDFEKMCLEIKNKIMTD
jgi:hypothetical protein